MLMKPCSSSCANASRRRRDEPNSANGSLSNIPWPMWVGGKGDGHVIVDCARISSICGGVLSSTTCTSWLVPSNFRLSFRRLLDFLTDALAAGHGTAGSHRWPVVPVQTVHMVDGCQLYMR